jgi:hypothetical protein
MTRAKLFMVLASLLVVVGIGVGIAWWIRRPAPPNAGEPLSTVSQDASGLLLGPQTAQDVPPPLEQEERFFENRIPEASQPPSADTDTDAVFTPPVIVPQDAQADPDNDGLTNAQERQRGTDPANADTDRDGLSDGDEIRTHRTDPLQADTDSDGLTDGEEVNRWKTDPLNPDTDGDSFSDGIEVKGGYNPLGSGKLP